MNRKEAIKGIATLGMMATIPSLVKFTEKKKNVHFVGLGSAGSRAMALIYQHGITAKYSYISDIDEHKIHSKISFIKFMSEAWNMNPIDIKKYQGDESDKDIVVPNNVKEIFNENDTYILLAGLGGNSGTRTSQSLIYWLNKKYRDYHAVFGKPFKLEAIRRSYVQKVINVLHKFPNVHYFDNATLSALHGKKTFREIFALSNNEYYEVVKSKGLV